MSRTAVLMQAQDTDGFHDVRKNNRHGQPPKAGSSLVCNAKHRINASPPAWADCITELNELRMTQISDVSQIYERPATCFITKLFYYYDEILSEWYWTPYDLNDDLWIPVDTLTVPSGFWAGQRPAQPNVEIISYLDENNPNPKKACGIINGDTSEEIGSDEQHLEPGSVSMVADIWEGSYSSNPAELTPCSGFLYFQGKKESSGWGDYGQPALYRYGSDVKGNFGSDSDSLFIEEVSEGTYQYLTCFNDELYYFKAPDASRYSDPWSFAKFDGKETVLYDTGENYHSTL